MEAELLVSRLYRLGSSLGWLALMTFPSLPCVWGWVWVGSRPATSSCVMHGVAAAWGRLVSRWSKGLARYDIGSDWEMKSWGLWIWNAYQPLICYPKRVLDFVNAFFCSPTFCLICASLEEREFEDEKIA